MTAEQSIGNDDRWLAVADLTGRVSVWDVTAGVPVARGIRHAEGFVVLEALGKDRLVSGGWDGSLRLTLLESAAPAWQIGEAATDLSTGITGLAAHPVKERVAYVAYSRDIGVCDILASACLWHEKLGRRGVHAAFSSDGRFVLVALADSGFELREAETGALLRSSRKAVATLAGGWLATVEDGGPLKLVDLATRAERCASGGGIEGPIAVATAPEGGRVVVLAGRDGQGSRLLAFDARSCNKLWETALGRSGAALVIASEPYDVVAVGGAFGGATYRLRDGISTGLVMEDRNQTSSLAFHPLRPILLVTGFSGRLVAYDLISQAQLFSVPTEAGIPFAATFDKSGHRFAVGFFADQQHFAARIFDTILGQQLGPALQHPREILAVAMTESGRYLVTGCADGILDRSRSTADRGDPRRDDARDGTEDRSFDGSDSRAL
jgi:hypothetical protein